MSMKVNKLKTVIDNTRVFSLSNKKDREAFVKFGGDDFYKKLTSIEEFINTGKSTVLVDGMPVLRVSDKELKTLDNDYSPIRPLYIVDDGLIFHSDFSSYTDGESLVNDYKQLSSVSDGAFMPIAALMYSPQAKCGQVLLNNADTQNDSDIKVELDSDYHFIELDEDSGIDSISVSFYCLMKLFECTEVPCLRRKLKDTILTGYSLDSRVSVSKSLATSWKNSRGDNKNASRFNLMHRKDAPEAGYSLVYKSGGGIEWHRPAVAVFSTYRSRNTFMMGMDENSYFGVELMGSHGAVDDCYDALMPDAARNVNGVLRQGEWFMIPVDADEVPDLLDCAINQDTYGNYGDAWLPRDNEDSAKHFVSSTDIRVSKNGQVYAYSPTIRHERMEHADLTGQPKTWYTFARNTAIRAVSAAGVD